MKKVDIGSIYLPDSIVEAVETHRKRMLETYKDTSTYNLLLQADFGMWFSDYLNKFGWHLPLA